ncbi:aspartate kinase [Natribacillus halophilus]|uniref:Aspartokinase n=1 Tax=Natribacillus halophilus TaxID=549003 RepID=A0A1G8PRM7_9BACI|nr:aspartate kinase [Natribacillus halophilus]SDI94998.1 aspartate kinase [Natribacillus halophilus]
MKIAVQKYGGTSVQSETLRQKAAGHVKQAVQDGYKVVVVVSAMGRMNDPYSTDTLLSLITGDDGQLPGREQDMLQACGEVISSVVFTNLLISEGLKASALTGKQAGFRTTEEFGEARITQMQPEPVLARLHEVDVVVVAGFQGESESGETTTLGRGGSDTSATALGAALKAKTVDIFTDVEGIMTADPRIVNDARPMKSLTYTEVANLAHQGAKVIHPRAVEIAMHAEVPIRIRSLTSDGDGTLVSSTHGSAPGSDVQERLITGITYLKGITQVIVSKEREDLEAPSLIFERMAAEGISVDFINIDTTSIVFTIPEAKSQQVERKLVDANYPPTLLHGCAKVSAVGAGMTGVPGVVSRITLALHEAGIDILQATDSHTTIWVLVREEELNDAVNALHGVFKLADNQ